MAGGLAEALSARTGFDVTIVRVVLVVAALVSYGICAAAYVVAWLLVPASGAQSSIGSKAMADKRGIGLAAGVASLLAVAWAIASVLHATWLTSLAVPTIVCAAGLVLIWRNAPPDEQELMRELADPLFGQTASGRKTHPIRRAVLAVVLVAVGMGVLVSDRRPYALTPSGLVRPVAGIVLLIAGIAVGLGPWWVRIAKDLVAERQARIRAEERADMASRVHDSVLQTLALIQRRAADPQQVVQLARAQERELRAWLFDGLAPGSLAGTATTLAAGVRLIQQEVEAKHGMTVEVVAVGDCRLDDDLNALLGAAREATVNAAKWSGADVVSLFAEAEPDAVSVYVRDRGRGFDPEAVPGDRKGLAESVRGRVARRGGEVTVRSAPGEGTEVSLRMPRLADDRLPRRP